MKTVSGRIRVAGKKTMTKQLFSLIGLSVTTEAKHEIQIMVTVDVQNNHRPKSRGVLVWTHTSGVPQAKDETQLFQASLLEVPSVPLFDTMKW